MDLKHLILWGFQASILAMVFGFGLKITVQDLLDLVRRPALLAWSLLAMFVVMPLIAVLLARAFEFRNAVEFALIALAISPLPALIPKTLTELRGRDCHAVAVMATIALLSILIVPLVVALLARYSGRPLAMSPWAVDALIAITVLLPLVAGMVFRSVRPTLAERIELPVSIVGGVLLRLAALALLFTNLPTIRALIVDGTIIAIVLFVVAGLAAGHLLGGPDADRRTVLALATASRHPAIALAIGSANVPEEQFGATILLYLLVSAMVGSPYAIWQRKKARDREAAAVILDAHKKAIDDIQSGRPAPYYVAPLVAAAPSEAASSPPSPDDSDAVKKTEG